MSRSLRLTAAVTSLVMTFVVALLVTLGTGAASAASRPPVTVTVGGITSTASAPVAAPGGAAGTDTTVSLTVNGLARSYLLFVPAALPAGPRPLVVALPYYTGTPALFEQLTGIDSGAATNGDFVAYHAGIGSSWNGGGCCGTAVADNVDDVGFITDVIHDVAARYAVDTNKLAVGGWSNGGIMAYRYACSGQTLVHDFFVGSGVDVAPSCSLPSGVALLHMHGLVDTTVPWSGESDSLLFTGGIVPNVPNSIIAFSKVDGCSGAFTEHSTSALVNEYLGQACRTGASVTVFTSATMGHVWSTGSADLAAYGLNETGLTWAWLLGLWATAG